MIKGHVYLVGAGPGDVELLTLKAVRAIALADLILVDDLVNRDVLKFSKPHAQVIWVGKRGGCKSTAQESIERQMISFALSGLSVVRLKGGDPFIFGRGGEELKTLTAAGVEVSIIPGITAGIAVPSAVGIPLTHRDHSCSITFITGHRRAEGKADWQALAQSGGTLVIYMGMSNLEEIVEQLLLAGMPASTPAAAIQNGTLTDQKHVFTTLAQLTASVAKAGLESPSIIVIGTVVSTSPHFEVAISFERSQAGLTAARSTK